MLSSSVPSVELFGNHASHETLALYLLGDLAVATTVVTREHLNSCRLCKAKLPEVRAVIAALRSGAF